MLSSSVRMRVDTCGQTVRVDSATRSPTEHKEASIKVYAKLVFEQTVTRDVSSIQTGAGLHNANVPSDSAK
jgi:hypothetical protein